ncbi:MAG TPA: DUF2252 domain-containing protein [Acidimicrobiales bacterium]|nr:DUF2252 domain-containing protein [Acidimicrobiales bacterium]
MPTTKTADRVVHLTAEERAAEGKAARAKAPLEGHGEWAPAADRPDPLALLEEQAQSRVPELVPIRHGRMAASPFAFFRGAAYVLAADLGPTPRSGLDVQLCGDAHLSNFGGFASPERTMVFDVNDFDETLPGPFEWDIKRLAASLEIAARDSGCKGSERTGIVRQATRAYRQTLRRFAGMTNLEVWYSRLDEAGIVGNWGQGIGAKVLKTFQQNVEKAQAKDRMKAMAKLTRRVDGELRIVSDPPLIVPVEEVFSDADAEAITEAVHAVLRSYRRSLPGEHRHLLESYRFVDVARKVVGVGSVGTRAWVALLLGRDDQDPLFVQVKEAEASVLEPFLGKSAFNNHGQRVVEGQHLMQAASDIFLGWERNPGMDGRPHDYYMRQLWDWKYSAVIETMTPQIMGIYGEICGWTLARAHARSGDRIAIASYLGNSERFDEAIARFARAYAEQNDLDHRALVEGIATGRMQAQSGV